MDIDSINAGTVDSKSWLNPTVGTLRANIRGGKSKRAGFVEAD